MTWIVPVVQGQIEQIAFLKKRLCLQSLKSGILSDAGIMPPLVLVVKFLKKIDVAGKIWEKAGLKPLRDPTEKSVNFST